MPPMPTSSRIRYPPGRARPTSGSSPLAATLLMGKPQDGQNLCASSHWLAHWGHDRMSLSHAAWTGPSEATTPPQSRLHRMADDGWGAKRSGELLGEGS